MAIWDLVAKIAGVPLLPPARRPLRRRRARRARLGLRRRRLLPARARTSTRCSDEMRGYLDLRLHAVKMKIGGAPLDEDLRRIEAVARGRRRRAPARGRRQRPLRPRRPRSPTAGARAVRPALVRGAGRSARLRSCRRRSPSQYAAAARDRREPVLACRMRATCSATAGCGPDRDVLQFDPALSYGLVEYLRTLDDAARPRLVAAARASRTAATSSRCPSRPASGSAATSPIRTCSGRSAGSPTTRRSRTGTSRRARRPASASSARPRCTRCSRRRSGAARRAARDERGRDDLAQRRLRAVGADRLEQEAGRAARRRARRPRTSRSAAGRAGARSGGRRSPRRRRRRGSRARAPRTRRRRRRRSSPRGRSTAVGRLVAAQQLERERARAVERVGARDDVAVEPERGRRRRDRALGLAVGRGLDRPREHGHAAVAELAEVRSALAHAALVVEDDLAGGADAGQRVADRDRRDLLGDRRPAAAAPGRWGRRRARRRGGRRAAGRARARGAGSPSASATSVLRSALVELALDGAHELLVPEVGEAADEQADDRRSRRRRARARSGRPRSRARPRRRGRAPRSRPTPACRAARSSRRPARGPCTRRAGGSCAALRPRWPPAEAYSRPARPLTDGWMQRT